MTEKQLSKALVENFENFKEDLTFEEYADMLDFWVDKDGTSLSKSVAWSQLMALRKLDTSTTETFTSINLQRCSQHSNRGLKEGLWKSFLFTNFNITI